MAITESEAEAWKQIFPAEFAKAKPPYYGVNNVDVRTEDWDAFLENVRAQIKGVEGYGGRLHLWAVSDQGAIKRVVWINYFPKSIMEAAVNLPEEFHARQMALTDEAMKLYDKYNWCCVSESSDL